MAAQNNQLNGLSLPYALGNLPPQPGYAYDNEPGIYSSNDPTQILTDIRSLLLNLYNGFFGEQFNQQVQFDNLAAGKQLETVLLTHQSYNCILVALYAGTVNMYYGNKPGNVADMQFNAVQNPIIVPFAPRYEQSLTFVCDSNSPAPALGNLYIMNYDA